MGTGGGGSATSSPNSGAGGQNGGGPPGSAASAVAAAVAAAAAAAAHHQQHQLQHLQLEWLARTSGMLYPRLPDLSCEYLGTDICDFYYLIFDRGVCKRSVDRNLVFFKIPMIFFIIALMTHEYYLRRLNRQLKP
jgi:hypothetical protein